MPARSSRTSPRTSQEYLRPLHSFAGLHDLGCTPRDGHHADGRPAPTMAEDGDGWPLLEELIGWGLDAPCDDDEF